MNILSEIFIAKNGYRDGYIGFNEYASAIEELLYVAEKEYDVVCVMRELLHIEDVVNGYDV
tara:strand:+ start:184 stop:366 length:183 start_codon:yes stop_codon:yes gene_type:complete